MNSKRIDIIKIWLPVFFIFNFAIVALAQPGANQTYPEIGKTFPPLSLKDVDHFPKRNVSLQDFKGRWLILDFWTKGCVACVKSFPKLNQLQKDFKEHIQFLLIGKEDHQLNKGIRTMYEKFRQKYNLELAITYDSLLFSRFGIQTTPHVIVVSPDGIVKAITTSGDLTNQNLRLLISGLEPAFSDKRISFDEEIEDNKFNLKSGEDVLFRSELSKWKKTQVPIINGIDKEAVTRSCYRAVCMSLGRLYSVAYTGSIDCSFGDSLYDNFWRFPVLEMKNELLFESNFDQAKGLYNYSLIAPYEKATKEYLQMVMQHTLKEYFGYEVSIEKRIMPYWKLVADPETENKLRTKGQLQSYTGDHAGIALTNIPVGNLLRTIWSYHQSEPPFIDETGLTENIDINIDALMTELSDIRQALQKNGLYLIKGEKQMKVLVIRDPQN